ncbi:MAG: NAD(P)H-hydrate dehydratase [Pseudomonadota bacterium]
MADADRQTFAGGYATSRQLMENAGYAILDIVLQRFGDAPRVHILCGRGNNGGDGFVIARLLVERGHPINLYALGSPKEGTDACGAAARWAGPVYDLDAFEPGERDLVVDAIFGAGGKGALPAVVTTALAKAAKPTVRLLAVDLPSGVDGDTGHARHDAPCDATVTFHRKKPGHVLEPGRSLCGDILVADIGVRAENKGSDHSLMYENHPVFWHTALQPPTGTTHKYARGHVAIFSGPPLATGASRLAAMAAQKGGAGAVTVLGTQDALQVHASHVTSTMMRAYGRVDDAFDVLSALNRCSAVVLGPGFGDMQGVKRIAIDVLNQGAQTLVLDADGLTAFENDSDHLFQAAAAGDDLRLILTPHDGEFGRLFPDLAVDQALSKIDKAVLAANRTGAIIVYKGRDSVIAAPRKHPKTPSRVIVNTNAPASLATAGSGDVLAGLVAALAARGMPVFEAAAAAVWLHGEAGSAAGLAANAEDIVSQLPKALDGASSALD